MFITNDSDVQNYSKMKTASPFPKPSQQATTEEQQLMELLKTNPELMQKYQEEVSRMQAQSKSAQSPMTSEEYLSKLPTIDKYLDSEGGLMIEPKQAFVLKFLEKRTNEKIFVNVVTHDVIDHPEEKLLVDFENQPGLRIPMSMGRMREDHDKNGNVCKVVDVVLNPKIVETAEANADIMGFTAQIIGNYLLEKHKIAVSEEALKKVKGLKYKGKKVEVQRVKGKKAPKIEQLSEEEMKAKQQQKQNEQKLLSEINEQPNYKAMKPQFSVFVLADKKYEPYSLQIPEYEHMKIVIDVPHLIHSKGIHLQGSERMIYLSVKNLYEICLKIPFEVGKWKSQFSRKQRKMQVLVYRKPKEELKPTIEQKVQDKPIQQLTGVSLDNDLLEELV